MQIYSFSPFGYEGSLVAVEVDLRRGIPAVDIVGLADGAVKESRERMHAAIRNSGFEFPQERVLISLSPADLRKEGAGFDLPVALSVLKANSSVKGEDRFVDGPVLVMGELELSGKLRSVKGIHAAVSTAVSCGIFRCVVPIQNADEAREVSGAVVYGADSLENAYAALKNADLYSSKDASDGDNFIPFDCDNVENVFFPKINSEYEYSELKGQKELIRGLQIAAAGGHNIMAVGSPGCGKTMGFQKFPAINPVLTLEESQSVTRIWSLAGLIKPSESLIRIPPFRMPHQTASIEGICGGGVNCRPGEISLAHNGVLFLDEASEFKTSVLQMLRVPLETGSITICRAGRSTVFPARFQLMMAVNPCPCGNFGSKTKICLCSARSIEQYWKKFSAPLLDRVDIRVYVENESSGNFSQRDSLRTTEEIRAGIAKAINFQRNRQCYKNANLTPNELQIHCELSSNCKKLIEKATSRYGFSPRATSSCIKISRTIADIDESMKIKEQHLEEAIEFRKLCNGIVPEL
ncbi:MAG: YifB family Mg chelatase-like AAA ATPase [Treponema sp.]|jgi:magnesium chelatase family protein|nr:YifB family Mg chelatase-like AAA ATPase [Treponema sp.]